MRSDRLRAQARLQLLQRGLDIRIDQAIQCELTARQIDARVRAGVGGSVELGQARSSAAEAAMAWHAAHLELFEAMQAFRAAYGADTERLPAWQALLPASEGALSDAVLPADRLAAQRAWVRRQSAIDLESLGERLLAGAEKARDAYRQKFDIGALSLPDLINTEARLADARVSNARAHARRLIAEIEILTLSGRIAELPAPPAGTRPAAAADFTAEVRAIDARIRGAVDGMLRAAPSGPRSDAQPAAGAPTAVQEGLVVAIRGKAMRLSAGKMAWLQVGDEVSANDEVVTWPGTVIEYLGTGDAAPAAGHAGGDGGSVMPTAAIDGTCAPQGLVGFQLPSLQWPPWPATDEQGIDPGGRRTLGELADYLTGALDRLPYVRHYAFAAVPGADGAAAGGFAIVTDLEQIHADGSAFPADTRWQARLPRAGEVGLLDFIRGLVVAPVGRYRVIVFIATDAPRRRGGAALADDSELRELALCGPTRLTDATVEMRELRARRVTADTDLRALVYEFTKRAQAEPARFLSPGLQALRHLERSGIMAALVARP